MVYFLSVRIWCRKITFRKKAPSTRIIRFCWETEGFFSGLAYRSHVFGENGHLKRIISKTVSRVKLFENAGHLFTCGRTKTEVSEYDDVIPLFSVFVWTAENDSNTLLVEAYFLENGGKTLRFQKYPDTFWGGLKLLNLQIFEKLIHNTYKEQKITQKPSLAWNTTHVEVSRIITYFVHK